MATRGPRSLKRLAHENVYRQLRPLESLERQLDEGFWGRDNHKKFLQRHYGHPGEKLPFDDLILDTIEQVGHPRKWGMLPQKVDDRGKVEANPWTESRFTKEQFETVDRRFKNAMEDHIESLGLRDANDYLDGVDLHDVYTDRPAKRPRQTGEGLDDLPDKEGAKAYLTATVGATKAGQTLARLERDFDYTREQREQVRRQRESYNRSMPGTKRPRELVDPTTGMTSTKKRIGAVLSNDDFAAQEFARQRQAIRQNAQQLAAQHATVTADRAAKVTEMARILSEGRQTHGVSFPWPGFSASDTQKTKEYASLLGVEMEGGGKRIDEKPRDRKIRKTNTNTTFFNTFDETRRERDVLAAGILWNQPKHSVSFENDRIAHRIGFIDEE